MEKYYACVVLAGCFVLLHCTSKKAEVKSETPLSALYLKQDAQTGLSGYADGRGNWQIAPGKYALCLTDTFTTHAIVAFSGKPGFFVINRAEQPVYEVFTYDNGPDYPSEGLFRIVKDGKMGYADARNFNVVIPPKYDCGYPFLDGEAKVSMQCSTTVEGEHSVWKSQFWIWINRKGEVMNTD